jgi:hypothetical protein
MDGEAVARASAEIIGLIITAFLLFLGLSAVITGLSQRWRLRKMKQALAEPVSFPSRIPRFGSVLAACCCWRGSASLGHGSLVAPV